jgi:hypothetical protein
VVVVSTFLNSGFRDFTMLRRRELLSLILAKPNSSTDLARSLTIPLAKPV